MHVLLKRTLHVQMQFDIIRIHAYVLCICFYTHKPLVCGCINVSFACCLCVPESAARRVMEHALLNDESEYSIDREENIFNI